MTYPYRLEALELLIGSFGLEIGPSYGSVISIILEHKKFNYEILLTR